MAQNNNSSRFRRKKFLINPKFQLTMIGFNAGLAGILIAIFYLENLYLFSKFTGAEDDDLKADPIILELIQEERLRMQVIFILTAIAVLATMIIGGLILSNRVAGPLYRLKNHMNDTIEGKTSGDVKFRDKDFFQEIAETYNQVLHFFRKK